VVRFDFSPIGSLKLLVAITCLLTELLATITIEAMQTVIQTPTFLADAKAAGLDDSELAEIAATIAANPLIGDIIPGTGGARKVQFGGKGKGKGKSGGYRVITYYAAEDVPVFLLALVDKGQRADISQANRNALREILGTLADEYREGVRRKLRQTRTKRNT
jgi:hypothetical protein